MDHLEGQPFLLQAHPVTPGVEAEAFVDLLFGCREEGQGPVRRLVLGGPLVLVGKQGRFVHEEDGAEAGRPI